ERHHATGAATNRRRNRDRAGVERLDVLAQLCALRRSARPVCARRVVPTDPQGAALPLPVWPGSVASIGADVSPYGVHIAVRTLRLVQPAAPSRTALVRQRGCGRGPART